MRAVTAAAVLTVVLSGLAAPGTVAAPTATAAVATTSAAMVPSTDRIAGADRVETAVAISQHAFPHPFTTGGSVYVARMDVFADAVAAGTLTDGPILLVPSCGTAPSMVVQEVKRLSPARVVGLGGTSALCDAMLNAVSGGRPTTRLAGPDRFATSVRIARERMTQGGATEVYLASGADSPDPVVGGQLTRGPIVLTSRRGLPDVVRDFLYAGPRRIVVLGGEEAVPREQADQVTSGYEIGRVAGATRVETAAGIALMQFPAEADTVYLARADLFADAVASGSLTDGPVLLVGQCSLPAAAQERIALARPARVVALGGPAAVCDAVLRQASAATSEAGGRLELMHRDAAGHPIQARAIDASSTADGRFTVWAGSKSGADGHREHGMWLHDRHGGAAVRIDVPPSGEVFTAPLSPSISDDGRLVVFRATQIDATTGESHHQIMLRDVASGVTTRLTNAPDGGPSRGRANLPRVSGDGSTVVFMSTAADLVEGDTNGVSDVFAVDVGSSTTSLVSRSVTDQSSPGNGSSSFPAVSRDGAIVVFFTRATNLAPGLGASSVVAADRGNGTVRNLSVDSQGQPIDAPLQFPSMTEDGRNVGIQFPTTAGPLLYRVDRGTGTRTLVSRDASGTPVTVVAGEISRDGSAAVYSTYSTSTKLLRRDLTTGMVQWLGAGFALQPGRQPTALALDGGATRVVLSTPYRWPFVFAQIASPNSVQTWSLLPAP